MAVTPGIGGALKSRPEDFLVEEILEGGDVLELDKPFSLPDSPGEFVHFVLQKKDWTTARALKEVADKLRVGDRRMNAAGNKDRSAVTTQRVSAFAVEKGKILALDIKDMKILGAWTATDKVRIGQLAGNRFTIRADGCDDDPERVQRIYDELDGAAPNYFGEQRFGSSRRNTHLVGEKILKGEAREAVEMYLTDSAGEGNTEAVAARKQLSEEWDYKKALAYYPRSLTHERTLLAQLARNPGDHVGALR
ncbi:MAG: tRNA pseudouridine(13) synthase TruD, partial [Candidatus Bilamarchaeaceae archaeon]